MQKRGHRSLLARGLFAGALVFVVGNAYAGDFLKCEKRGDPQRSKVSVETEDLVAGAVYTATVRSGTRTAMSTRAANPAGVVEYDFDSNRRDIAEGATAIPSNFISGGKASAKVTDALGNVVASGTASCRMR